jgi:hypothetical protein
MITDGMLVNHRAGWLVGISVKSGTKKTDMYQLSSRARAELQYYLVEEYPNQMDKAYECKTCSEHVMKVSARFSIRHDTHGLYISVGRTMFN